MVAGAVRAEAESGAGVSERPGVVLADAGYWSNDHIDSLRERGIIPIVARDTTHNLLKLHRHSLVAATA